MRMSFALSLLTALIVALVPLAALAQCTNISQIEFDGWAPAPNIDDVSGKPFTHNKMGVVRVRSTPTGTRLTGPIGGAGFAGYASSDPPRKIFDRLAAVITGDDFFSIAEPQEVESISPVEANSGIMEVAVTVAKCGESRTIRESFPLDETAHIKGSSKLLRLFNDLVAATYQSRWTPEDIY